MLKLHTLLMSSNLLISFVVALNHHTLALVKYASVRIWLIILFMHLYLNHVWLGVGIRTYSIKAHV